VIPSFREVLVVARDDIAAAMRSMLGAGALLLYVGMNLAVAIPSLALAEMLRKQFVDASGAEQAIANAATKFVWFGLYKFLTGAEETAKAMLDIPVQAVLTFWAAALFAPLLCVLVGYDAAAGDLQSGRLRYLAVRCRRSSLIVGRWLGRSLLVAAVVIAVTMGVYALMIVRGEDLGIGAWRHFLRYGLMAAAVVPCWMGVAVLASTLVSTARGGLMQALMLLFVLVIAGATETAGPASPTWYKALLYSPTTWPEGVAAYAGFACLFLMLAILRLARRDI
jgi:ABC-type transport system involved in multi-copper enzyme maturation permease subunit